MSNAEAHHVQCRRCKGTTSPLRFSNVSPEIFIFLRYLFSWISCSVAVLQCCSSREAIPILGIYTYIYIYYNIYKYMVNFWLSDNPILELQHCNSCNSESIMMLASIMPSANGCRRSQHCNSESIMMLASIMPSANGCRRSQHCNSESITTGRFCFFR